MTDPDGYRVCVSAVAPVPGREPLTVDAPDGRLVIRHSRWTGGDVVLDFARQPDYYDEALPSGQPITRVVSCCGESELNIWPWHDCAIGPLCRFCGVNRIQRNAGSGDVLTARNMDQSRPGALETWFADLAAAMKIAVDDPIYTTELFPMIISGNLPTGLLDRQAKIYAEIAREVTPLLGVKPGHEGLVATTAPPEDLGLLKLQAEAGIRTMAINLEVFDEAIFEQECPGKARIGRERYLAALVQSAEVFGRGFAWTNFVVGLEPLDRLLQGCAELARLGIVPGASVLHFDEGATVRGVLPPSYEEVLAFYDQLADLYHENDFRPYFSSRALRSSLANEAFAGRL